ncbi:MAG: CopG family transcriptional regulator [Acidobacteria bacterium]|nr:CopG family transcriptional regulator [Acidobacteriota bacterium]
MRTTAPLSITLPPEMLDRARLLARKENRTMSELMREAYRQYERKRRWDEINEYGRERAAKLGISEKDVPDIVKEHRRTASSKSSSRAK